MDWALTGEDLFEYISLLFWIGFTANIRSFLSIINEELGQVQC